MGIKVALLVQKLRILLIDGVALARVEACNLHSRASKTHGHADGCPRKILNFECKSCKTGTFSYFWYNFTKFFQILNVLLAISPHNSAQNFMKENSDRAKKITFRRCPAQQACFKNILFMKILK